ncbi:MAG: MFS transporter [Rhodospirillales bacterium]|nr:MFS transporter [Rhodospirillales bacterium]
MSNSTALAQSALAARLAFRHADYRKFWVARLTDVFVIDMQITVVSWQVYQLTDYPLDLGLVGLAQFMPFLLLFLVSGTVVYRFQRKRIMAVCEYFELIDVRPLKKYQ